MLLQKLGHGLLERVWLVHLHVSQAACVCICVSRSDRDEKEGKALRRREKDLLVSMGLLKNGVKREVSRIEVGLGIKESRNR